ncbi:hypothetical protein NQ314_005169 [Rhamnusium bicolor]|uniref:4-nitrophenylphosphatase n=1 Tax=Rhamnusium bicolor TaxID=1586634 RepID=A0AAV8ZK33_9CUCU|nr:hypothetical protein NQ314_005169 [Rhamnusium bicolor]
MKNLAEVPTSEQLEFLNSFDHALCDLDGVLWIHYRPLSGAAACINSLKQRGKQVHYVSNNSTVPIELVKDRMKDIGLDTDINDIIELYVIGLGTIKDTLKKAGFLIADGPQQIQESISSVVDNINDNENIGGVLLELDININFIKLQKAVTYLKRKDCIFIASAADAQLPNGQNGYLIDLTGREPHQIAKPSLNYNEFIVERFKITDPVRVLFIGDSVKEDLNFATKCGYQKLLVLSGITKKGTVIQLGISRRI